MTEHALPGQPDRTTPANSCHVLRAEPCLTGHASKTLRRRALPNRPCQALAAVKRFPGP
jgi:hypothetical protein